MSVLRLSHFPDLCLLAIFEHIPLLDIIRTVGGVCKNWSRLQRNELNRRRILGFHQDRYPEHYYADLQKINPFGCELIEKVYREDGSPWLRFQSRNQMQHNALPVPNDLLTEGFTTQILQILPRITHLSVMQYISRFSVSSAVRQMIILIEHNAIRLVSLKIDFFYYYEEADEEPTDHEFNYLEANVLALLDSINQLESLRHLTLKVDSKDIMKISPKIKLPILSRLSTFRTVQNWLSFSMLAQYANKGNVRLNCDRICSLDELLLVDPQLSIKFVRVIVRDMITGQEYEKTRLLCFRFSSLSSLRLKLESMPMTMLARCLSQLTQLIHLELMMIPRIPTDEKTPEPTIVPVPSVRLLSLKIRTESHLDTEHLHLSEIFPNLQMLNLTHFSVKCSECHLDSSQLKNESKHFLRFVQCMRQSRQPFRLCANLHTVKLDTWGPHWEALSSLLPQGLITVEEL